MYPDDEPGRVASGLRDVLSAETLAEAKAVLDELGFSTLEAAPSSPASATITVGTLGGTTSPTEATAPETSNPTAPEAVEALLGSNSAAPAPPPAGLEERETPLGSIAGERGTGQQRGRTAGTAVQTPPGRAPRRGRLRSYVVRDPTPRDGEPDSAEALERSSIAQAGIAKVVAFERAEPHNRQPKVMPTNHPGYDIESSDATGNIARHIEVKSLSGLWGADGVGLTSAEFSMAGKLGHRYWLYVVEKAESPDARIYCIQDPARKVDQFLYDNGWQETSTP